MGRPKRGSSIGNGRQRIAAPFVPGDQLRPLGNHGHFHSRRAEVGPSSILGGGKDHPAKSGALLGGADRHQAEVGQSVPAIGQGDAAAKPLAVAQQQDPLRRIGDHRLQSFSIDSLPAE